MATDDEEKVLLAVCDVIKGSTLLKAGRSVSIIKILSVSYDSTNRESHISGSSNYPTTSLD